MLLRLQIMSEAHPHTPELPHIAVVIPTFRAEEHIAEVIRGIPSFVRTIVVVVDASPDDSAEQARATAETRLHVVELAENRGVGGATMTGYRKAVELGADILVKMDSDGQMDPQLLPELIAPLVRGEADYSKGNRFLLSRHISSMPLLRRIGNVGLSFLTKLASGYWQIFDPTNGYTALHRSAFERLDERAIASRYFFETSLLVELRLCGAVAADIAMPARYGDEKSNLSERDALFRFPPRLLKSFLHRIWLQHFVRDFGLFSVFFLSGLLLSTFGMSFGIYNWIRYASVLEEATPVGTIMLSVLPVILGVQFLLQAFLLDIQGQPSKPLQVLDQQAAAIRVRSAQDYVLDPLPPRPSREEAAAPPQAAQTEK